MFSRFHFSVQLCVHVLWCVCAWADARGVLDGKFVVATTVTTCTMYSHVARGPWLLTIGRLRVVVDLRDSAMPWVVCRVVDVSHNQLSSSLPSAIGALTKLTCVPLESFRFPWDFVDAMSCSSVFSSLSMRQEPVCECQLHVRHVTSLAIQPCSAQVFSFSLPQFRASFATKAFLSLPRLPRASGSCPVMCGVLKLLQPCWWLSL